MSTPCVRIDGYDDVMFRQHDEDVRSWIKAWISCFRGIYWVRFWFY